MSHYAGEYGTLNSIIVTVVYKISNINFLHIHYYSGSCFTIELARFLGNNKMGG